MSFTRSRRSLIAAGRQELWPPSTTHGSLCVARRRVAQGEDLAELDASFHESLIALIGNETLIRELKAINERLFVFRMIDFGSADRVESTCIQHLNVLDRIAAKDVGGAREAIRMNIESGRNIVHATFKDALARAYATL